MAHPWKSVPLSRVVIRTCGRCGYLAFGLWQTEVEACCLVRMDAGRSKSLHEAESSFYAITKVSRNLDTSTVQMMSIYKCVNEAHHHDRILEASKEHLSDQVMEKMVSSWEAQYPVLKKIETYHAKEGIRCCGRGSRFHSDIQHDTLVHNPQCEIFELCIARCRGCEERQQ